MEVYGMTTLLPGNKNFHTIIWKPTALAAETATWKDTELGKTGT